MDPVELQRLAGRDRAQRDAWIEALLARADRAAPWQRPILRKRLEELRAESDGGGEWDRPESWIARDGAVP